MTLASVLEQARELSHHEQKELIKYLVDLLSTERTSQKTYQLHDLRGRGKEVWEDIDTASYLNEIRNEWN